MISMLRKYKEMMFFIQNSNIIEIHLSMIEITPVKFGAIQTLKLAEFALEIIKK